MFLNFFVAPWLCVRICIIAVWTTMSIHRKLILSFLLVLLFAAGATPDVAEASPLGQEQIADLYSQAKDLFRQANELAGKSPETARDFYAKSAMRYERIIQEGGIRNGRLYYNLGNIYFRIKDMGRAILNFRRAEQYISNDPNLKQNLAYARKMRLDQIQEKQETRVLKTLFFWHYDLSTQTRVILFTICFVLLWIFAGLRIFVKRSFLGWCIVTAAALSISLSASLVVDDLNLRRTKPGVIVSREVVARKGNSETYEPSFKEPLHAGTEFILMEDRGNWLQIELADSRTCWVPSKDVELVR